MIAGAAAVLAVGYAHRPGLSKRPDATTPVAAMGTLGLGFIAGFGNPGLAIAGATIVTLLLALKQETHHLIDRLDEDDVKALARYAVIAGAVLPFLPSGHYGPLGAWDPRNLWLVVVIVTGFSFLGYAANRMFGERHGTIATAVIGGLYSSTAVTQSLAQRLGRGKVGGRGAGRDRARHLSHVRARADPRRRPRDPHPGPVRNHHAAGDPRRRCRRMVVVPQIPAIRRADRSGQSDRLAPGAWLCDFCRGCRGRRWRGRKTASGSKASRCCC